MRTMRAVLGLALTSVALLSGCGGEARDATSKELAALTAEISKLRAAQAAQAERLDALERGRPRSGAPLPAPKAESAASPAATTPLDGDRPSLDVVRLGPSDEAPDEVDGDIDAEGPRTVLRSGSNGIVVEETGPGGATRVTADSSGTSKKAPPKKSDKADRKKTASVSTP
jgi:outer membrane murein-binding lipoprotein Lpp